MKTNREEVKVKGGKGKLVRIVCGPFLFTDDSTGSNDPLIHSMGQPITRRIASILGRTYLNVIRYIFCDPTEMHGKYIRVSSLV